MWMPRYNRSGPRCSPYCMASEDNTWALFRIMIVGEWTKSSRPGMWSLRALGIMFWWIELNAFLKFTECQVQDRCGNIQFLITNWLMNYIWWWSGSVLFCIYSWLVISAIQRPLTWLHASTRLRSGRPVIHTQFAFLHRPISNSSWAAPLIDYKLVYMVFLHLHACTFSITDNFSCRGNKPFILL